MQARAAGPGGNGWHRSVARTVPLFVAALTVVLLAACEGCGSGGDQDAAPPPETATQAGTAASVAPTQPLGTCTLNGEVKAYNISKNECFNTYQGATWESDTTEVSLEPKQQ